MKPTHDTWLGVAGQEVVRLASAPWGSGRLAGAVVGRWRGVVPMRPGRRSGGSWGLQAGDRRAPPA